MMASTLCQLAALALCGALLARDRLAAAPPLAILGGTIHTMNGPPLCDGVVLLADGKVQAVGPAGVVAIPVGATVLKAAVVTPGLIDAHCVIGLSGHLNQKQDQDQLDTSTAMQPELRAIDAYNPQERLIEWVRGFGVTTLHTGHAPGALISGQTMIVKTCGKTVEEATVRPTAMVAVTLGDAGRAAGKDAEKKSPGTRSKAVAMLRGELMKGRDYLRKRSLADASKHPDKDLHLEAIGEVLEGRWPLLVTADRAADIASALRIAEEFGIRIVLDSGAESYLLIEQLQGAKVPVIVHPTMRRSGMGETENLSFETAAKLRAAGIPVALQSGYESYVPKARVVLFEAGVAAANGLSLEEALATITIDAARILGIEERVGSLQPGRDGDVALFDGDPFEYTTHCIGTVVNGELVSRDPR